MSSNSFTWVTEGGDLGTADWGCLAAAAPACVCRLNTVAVRQAALVSDESALEACACSRRCAIKIDDLYLYLDQTKQLGFLPCFSHATNFSLPVCHFAVSSRSLCIKSTLTVCYANYA